MSVKANSSCIVVVVICCLFKFQPCCLFDLFSGVKKANVLEWQSQRVSCESMSVISHNPSRNELTHRARRPWMLEKVAFAGFRRLRTRVGGDIAGYISGKIFEIVALSIANVASFCFSVALSL